MAATGGSEWLAVARSDDVTTRPRRVLVDGVALVLLRLSEGGPALCFLDRCPHRLVPLSAGEVDGPVLRCQYHGWEFGADGRCVTLPSLGPAATIPPRAQLRRGPRLREEGGTVHLARDTLPPEAQEATDATEVDEPDGTPASLSNVDESLWYAWHPVALSTEVGTGDWRAPLLGTEWTVRRTAGGLSAQPEPAGLVERWGLVWLAPRTPLVPLFDEPDTEDREYAGAWLPPATTPAPAGVVADNFLDVAHFPFVHAGTFGAGEEKEVPPYQVTAEPDGSRSVQEQWFDNPEDPGVRAGIRPVRQRRRATYVYRAPFQLLLRLEELDAGAVKTILFFVAPQALTSSRIYTKMLLYGIGGVPRPDAAVVAREVAFEEAVLAEDLALQRRMVHTALPLRMRDELHVRADRSGAALRRELTRFVTRARAQAEAAGALHADTPRQGRAS